MRTLWIVGPTTVVAAAVVIHLATRAHALSEERSEERAALAKLQQDVQSLARDQRQNTSAEQIAALRAAHAEGERDPAEPRHAPAGSAAPRPAVDAPEAPEGARKNPETLEEAQALMDDYVDTLEGSFTAEAPDAAWARGAERTAEEALRAALPRNSSLAGVTCRQTLCRVEVKHSNLEGHRELVQGLAQNIDWPGPSAILAQGTTGGEVTTLAYLGRADATFPSLER